MSKRSLQSILSEMGIKGPALTSRSNSCLEAKRFSVRRCATRRRSLSENFLGLGFLPLLVDHTQIMLLPLHYGLWHAQMHSFLFAHLLLWDPFSNFQTKHLLHCTTSSQSMNAVTRPTGIYRLVILVQHHLQEQEAATTLNTQDVCQKASP